MNVNTCRDESLQLVLGDHADHPDYETVIAHLNECNHCQQRLDDLAARPSWWDNSRRYLSDLPETSVPDLPGMENLVTAQIEESPDAGLADVQAFLEPPRHPEMLGRVGKYEIEREIGRGGMGIVLKGFDSELNRPVAVKLLAPHLASSGTARQRFVREGRAAAAVVHENVVAIYGIETNGPLPSIVMPYISGLSLQQYVDERGALDAVDVVRIGIQVASGLAAAHAQGLVHRDIKPGNIILENEINRVQITDFGLARAAHDANLTRSGIIAGTPSFMSPEQALSECIDHRSDLFSLGSVLYFAATGQLPFRASTPLGVLQQVCNRSPLRPRDANAQIPQQLEMVIEKLLAKSADERFCNATELQQYLNEYLAHLQQPTIKKAPRRLVTPFARQRRRVFWGRVGKYAAVPLALSVLVMAMVWRPEGVSLPTDVRTSVGSSSSVNKTESRDVTRNPSVSDSTPPSAESAAREQGDLKLEHQVIDPPGRRVSDVDDFDTRIQQLTADVTEVEIPQPGTSHNAATESSFDMELQRIDNELRMIEQDQLPTSP